MEKIPSTQTRILVGTARPVPGMSSTPSSPCQIQRCFRLCQCNQPITMETFLSSNLAIAPLLVYRPYRIPRLATDDVPALQGIEVSENHLQILLRPIEDQFACKGLIREKYLKMNTGMTQVVLCLQEVHQAVVF